MRVFANMFAAALLPVLTAGGAFAQAVPQAAAPPPAAQNAPGGKTTKTYTTSAADNARFLADVAARPDTVKLPDGVMYRVVKTGTGTPPISRQDVVTVTYTGLLINGQIFDQSKPDMPGVFQVGQLIKGWTEALFKMKAGDEWEVIIPAALGYGEEGSGDRIPPNQTLVFIMQLDKVEYAP
jgi:FKBP-type peptidyl-prolyl cis-trans isomerase